MNKQHLYGLINPFERIAGLEALLWGLAGMGVSTALSYYSGWHYHGLLHFGPAPNPAWWCYAVEHLAVWLIPAVMFYLGGLLLSRSHTDGRCVGDGRFRTIAVDRHEPYQLLAAYAEARTDRREHVSGRDHATARIYRRDVVVARRFRVYDLDFGLDVPGIESVL